MPLVEKIHYLKTDSEAKQERRALNAWMWEGVGGKGKIRQGDTKNVEEERKISHAVQRREEDRNFDLTNADVTCPIPTSCK